MSGQDLNDIIYEMASVIVLFLIFYIVLCTMGIFRIKDLNFTPNRHLIAYYFYTIIIFLCIFRISTLIYLDVYVLQISTSQQIGNHQLNVFFIFYPDCFFWIGMSSFFWLVFLTFYSSHISNEDLHNFNTDKSRSKLRTQSEIFMILSVCFYAVVEITMIFVYFSDTLSYLEFASIQAGFNIFIPTVLFYFIRRMYRKFSGTFYISDEYKKISQNGSKTMMVILTIRFIFGITDFSLLQTSVNEYMNYDGGQDFHYYKLLLGITIISVSTLFLEVIPIYLTFHISILKLCLKTNNDMKDSPGLKEDQLIDKNNKTSLENDVLLKTNRIERFSDMEKKTNDSEKFAVNFTEELRKFDYKELTFAEDNANIMKIKNKFGTIKFANSPSIINSTVQFSSYEFCVRIIEIPALNRFLLEDIERDMNKYMQIQSKMKNKIVNLIGYSIYKYKENVCLIYENMRNGSLSTLLSSPQNDALSFKLRMKILLDLAIYMNELHNLSIVHGHLTPNNIFFDGEFNMKIGDLLFYDLKKYTGYTNGYTNKSRYTAPEYLKDNGFSVINPVYSADVYSFSIISWEILTKDSAFKNVKRTDLKKILIDENSRPKIPEEIPLDLAKLIRCCWQSEANNRPSFFQIVNSLQEFTNSQMKND